MLFRSKPDGPQGLTKKQRIALELQGQLEMAQKYKDTHKTVLKDTSDKTKAGKPEQSSGEHITKFFNRKGDEILKQIGRAHV